MCIDLNRSDASLAASRSKNIACSQQARGPKQPDQRRAFRRDFSPATLHLMCGRYNLKSNPRQLAEHFGVPLQLTLILQQSWNVAPTMLMPVVRLSAETAERELAVVRWGLVPRWSSDRKAGQINARGETVATKPMFREAFLRRRCLVAADGFYEWKPEPDGKTKQPWFITTRTGGPLAFAGIWEPSSDPATEPETFSIITTSANDVLASIHNRMPVILSPDDYSIWLSDDTDVPRLEHLLRPYPNGQTDFWPVSKVVNNVRNQTEECIVPLNARSTDVQNVRRIPDGRLF